jgi:hypothetical protein
MRSCFYNGRCKRKREILAKFSSGEGEWALFYVIESGEECGKNNDSFVILSKKRYSVEKKRLK